MLEKIEESEGWRFKQVSQRGGLNSIVRHLVCEQEPRLSVLVKYDFLLKKKFQVCRLDGIDHVSFAAAVARLAIEENRE